MNEILLSIPKILFKFKIVRGLLDVLGDSMFNYPVDQMVKIHIERNSSPLWAFTMSYKYSHSLATVIGHGLGYQNLYQLRPELIDATHGVELSLMFPHFIFMLGPLTELETQVRIESNWIIKYS